jgi:hypothetical protein
MKAANFKMPVVLQTKEGQWVVLGLLALVIVYYVGKKVLGAAGAAAGAAASAAGGALSGNNSLTQGTPYQGAGALGTLGAATNTVSGGAFSSLGNWLSGQIADVTMPYDPNSTQPTGINRDQVVTPNYVMDIGDLTGQAQQTWQ